jgi:hypothetical protein
MIYDKTNQFTIPFMFLITMTTISYQKTMTTIIEMRERNYEREREREREYSGSFEGRPDSGKSPMIFHLYLTNSGNLLINSLYKALYNIIYIASSMSICLFLDEMSI